jgi:hypothetical protein
VRCGVAELCSAVAQASACVFRVMSRRVYPAASVAAQHCLP